MSEQETTAETVDIKNLLLEILDQQKRQTYLLAFTKCGSDEAAREYTNGVASYIQRKKDY